MSLRSCPACGGAVASNAKCCPSCGRRPTRLITWLVLFAALGWAGCVARDWIGVRAAAAEDPPPQAATPGAMPSALRRHAHPKRRAWHTPPEHEKPEAGETGPLHR